MQAEVDSSKVRGRAYNCGRCSDFCGERRRVVAHLYKYHVPLAEAPYYCTLCTFRCLTLLQLENHVTSYREHVLKEAAAEEGDENFDVRNHLKKSCSPYTIQETDLKRLSKEESQAIWKKRSKKTTDQDQPSDSFKNSLTHSESAPTVHSQPTTAQPTNISHDILDLGLNESFNFEHLFSDSPLPTVVLSPQPQMMESSTINTPPPPLPVTQQTTTEFPSSPKNPPSIRSRTSAASSASSNANCEVTTVLKSIENSLGKLDKTMSSINRGLDRWTDAVKGLTDVLKGLKEEKEKKEDTRHVLSSHHWDNRKRDWRRQHKY